MLTAQAARLCASQSCRCWVLPAQDPRPAVRKLWPLASKQVQDLKTTCSPRWQQPAVWACSGRALCALPSKSLWVRALKAVAKLALRLARKWAAKQAQQSGKLPAVCWAALDQPTVWALP